MIGSRKVLKRLVLVTLLFSGLSYLWHYTSRNEGVRQVTRADVFEIVTEGSNSKFTNNSRFATLESLPYGVKIGNSGSPSRSAPVPIEVAIKQCMEISNLDQSLNVSQSQKNARYLYDEYRKIIPEHSIGGYLSHCWRISYLVHWSGRHINGQFGNWTFEKTLSMKNSQNEIIVKQINKHFPAMKFKSDMMCLPNLFLAGFPKCGSTYLYCVVNKLIDFATARPRSYHEAVKEPHFWVSANDIRDVYVPTAEKLQEYFLNFIPGLQETASLNQSQILLMDASPNMFFKFPRFRESEEDLTNYCLIPSVLPGLLPHSKYLVIVRNPVKMMYSAFWFSCTTLQGKLPMSVQLEGPQLFHDRVLEKLAIFNNCMRDTTVPALNYICSMDSKEGYTACILKRLHLLDKCVRQIQFNNFSPKLSGCGRTRLAMGVYYVHIRKWLQVVSKERFLFLTLEDLVTDANLVMINVLKFLGLNEGTGFDSMATRIQSSCTTNSQSSVNYKKDSRLAMRNDTNRLLNTFFHPFNHLLGNLINRSALWNT